VRNIHSSIGRYISILHRYGQIYLDKELKKYNIGSGQFYILKVLYYYDGINQEEIGRFLRQDKSTTAKNIRKLVEEGFVLRKVDKSDRRAYRIFLTKNAQKIKPLILKILRRWTDILSTGFSKEEKKNSLVQLSRMVENAEKFFLKLRTDERYGK